MRVIVLALMLMLGACQNVNTAVTGVPNITKDQVYSLKASYTAIRAGLAAYRSLPYCSSIQPAPCQQIEVARQIKTADAAATTALDALQVAQASGSRINIFNAYTVASQAISTVTKIKQLYAGG